MKKVIIPPPPKPHEITQKERQYLEEWKAYLKNAHPRIIVLSPGDEHFDLKKFENAAKTLSNNGDAEGIEFVELSGWPKEEQVAFVVCLDSSTLSENKKLFLSENACIFCYSNIAIPLNRYDDCVDTIERGPESETVRVYALTNWESHLLEWKFITKLFIDRVQSLEERVPSPPEN